MEKENLTYKAHIFCSNCTTRGEIEIKRGTLVENTPCLYCGNNTLSFDHNWQLSERKHGNNFPNYE